METANIAKAVAAPTLDKDEPFAGQHAENRGKAKNLRSLKNRCIVYDCATDTVEVQSKADFEARSEFSPSIVR